MGKKSSQSSRKMSNKTHHHDDNKYFNSLIKVLKPKVFITDSSNFKTLVQELTGNNGNGNGNPIPFLLPPSPPHTLIQEPVMEIPVIENGYLEPSSLDESSVDSSSDALSMLAADSCPEEVYVSETFNVLETTASCLNNNIHKREHNPTCDDIESWLLQIDSSSSASLPSSSCSSYDLYDIAGNISNIPPFQQEVSFFYDLSSLM